MVRRRTYFSVPRTADARDRTLLAAERKPPLRVSGRPGFAAPARRVRYHSPRTRLAGHTPPAAVRNPQFRERNRKAKGGRAGLHVARRDRAGPYSGVGMQRESHSRLVALWAGGGGGGSWGDRDGRRGSICVCPAAGHGVRLRGEAARRRVGLARVVS